MLKNMAHVYKVGRSVWKRQRPSEIEADLRWIQIDVQPTIYRRLSGTHIQPTAMLRRHLSQLPFAIAWHKFFNILSNQNGFPKHATQCFIDRVALLALYQ